MLAQVLLFEGFDPLDALAPFEVLWAGSEHTNGRLSVEFAALDGPGPVPSGLDGWPVQATVSLDPERADIILVPGAAGKVEGDNANGLQAILRRVAASALSGALVRLWGRPGTTVATVCGGSLILGIAGLLGGRHAATHHLCRDVLVATGANLVSARVVDDGNLVSGGGVTSGLDVALHLLEREFGPEVAIAVEKLFEYERRGTVWRARRPNAA